MLIAVEMAAHSDQTTPTFPQQCVYCCGSADEHVDFEFHQPYKIGDWSLDLSKQFNLPVAGLSKRVHGFEVSVTASTAGTGSRKLEMDCRAHNRVPYCASHRQLTKDIEEAKEPNMWLTLGLMVSFTAVTIVLASKGVFSLSDGVLFNYLLAVVAGFAGGLGVAFALHRLSGPKGPAERVDYLESTWTGAGGGALGWRGSFGNNKKLPHEFLANPSVPVLYEFTNETYAVAFAEANSGEIKPAE